MTVVALLGERRGSGRLRTVLGDHNLSQKRGRHGTRGLGIGTSSAAQGRAPVEDDRERGGIRLLDGRVDQEALAVARDEELFLLWIDLRTAGRRRFGLLPAAGSPGQRACGEGEHLHRVALEEL
jgi:hypothetical protein